MGCEGLVVGGEELVADNDASDGGCKVEREDVSRDFWKFIRLLLIYL